MGRIADAWRALRTGQADPPPDSAVAEGPGVGHSHPEYLRRDEVPALMAQIADMEVAVVSTLEKLNTMAARLRKREQRAAAAGEAPGSPETAEGAEPSPDPSHHPKSALYAAARARRH